MSKKTILDDQDIGLFREAITGVRQIKQDTIRLQSPAIKQKAQIREIRESQQAQHYFSDEYEPLLSQEGPVRYNRSDVSAYEVKKLRRGDYIPDMMLDLHGLTQQQAKSELGALIEACRRQHIRCACVMHGHGKNILKQRIPLWLAQHPDVMAFHQATKLWGGDAAILVLIEQNS
ncbi:endonuclease SmrB [Tolumonas osonensis]|uniref:Ribosome rescue factor SmrB n=1 Tax=Tolumonas osonensis TaxID=675874 RepID=A0A841GPG7_9GAMM|nr:endonuclease SmrB [Tolumonas osonensis]MBB6055393.1 DNA-nicking Smr family endonuclease [Tolumonas osonensis]